MKKKAVVIGAAVLALSIAAGTAALLKAKQMDADMRVRFSALEAQLAVLDKDLQRVEVKIGSKPESYCFDYAWLDGDPLIAHALGGIGGRDYTNSKEALEQNYESGHRVFEADLHLTSDGRLVLVHAWEQFREYAGAEASDASMPAAEFAEADIFGAYTPMTWEDLAAFMSLHPDLYVVTDMKSDAGADVNMVFSSLVWTARQVDPSVLDRVVVQIYNQPMLAQVMRIYPFKSVIYTLYRSGDNDQEVLKFCAGCGIGAVTMPESRCTEDFVAALAAEGISALVHTVNDGDSAKKYAEMGVRGLYTDFLTPDAVRGIF